MNFIFENWEGIAGVVLALHGLALAVVNLTPTPKDNEALAKAYKWVNVFAGLFTNRAQPK